MQAYESVPCPYCGATWNPPDARFCQDCQRSLRAPIAKKAPGKALLIAVGGFLVAIAVAGLVVVPAMASSELAKDQQALTDAAGHQVTVDAAIKTFLTPRNAQTKQGGIYESFRQLDTFKAALAAVRSDKQRIEDADHRLDWMGRVAVSKQAEIARIRGLNQTVLKALIQGEGALQAAVDQAGLIQALDKTSAIETQMLTAANAKDYAKVEQLYPDADRQVIAAESLARNPDMPEAARSFVALFRLTIDGTEKLMVAAQNHDPLAGQNARSMLEGVVKNSSTYGADFAVKWDDWNVRNLQPMLDAYDKGLREAHATGEL